MPELDPIADHPQFTGPTRDLQKTSENEIRYRREQHQIDPQRVPVTLRTKQRPMTYRNAPQALEPQRVPVLIRSSNQSPEQAGTGKHGSIWQVADPGAFNRGESFLGEEAAAKPAITGKGLAIGAAVGVAFALLMRRR